MAQVLQFPLQPQSRSAAADADKPGELVAMRGIDLDQAIRSLRFLQSLDNQSYLDIYNRRRDEDGRARG